MNSLQYYLGYEIILQIVYLFQLRNHGSGGDDLDCGV